MAQLRRIIDGAGDAGANSQAISWNEDGTLKEVVGDEPTVGCSMLVGSASARSYSSQDYWLTTPVVRILEKIKNENARYVRFATSNSEYEWWTGEYPKKNKEK